MEAGQKESIDRDYLQIHRLLFDPTSVTRLDTVSIEDAVAAVKTGLLPGVGAVRAIANTLARYPRAPLVVDPVITATGGDSLLEGEAIKIYVNELFPLATLITPNLYEADQLLGQSVSDRQSMERAGTELARKFKTAILLKGGHLTGNDAVDLLFANRKVTEFAAPFVRDVATHGTGCTYSAAITAGLAAGMKLKDAIERAKKFVTDCIVNRIRWESEAGGSVDALRHSPMSD